MAAVDKLLVDRDAGIIKLLDPPFDTSKLEPGYIKGYVPGVRENGGQYTHAAIWAAMAFAMMGDAERAWQFFEMLNPVHHGDLSGVSGALQGGALRRERGRLRRAAAYRPGRLDVVHRRGGLDVQAGRGDVDRSPAGRRQVTTHAVAPGALGVVQGHYRYRETFYHITIKRVAKAPGQRV